jgi:hypothetical protein
MVNKKKRIFVLYLVFRQNKIDPGLKIINSICQDLYPHSHIIPVIIENSCKKNEVIKTGETYIISGDNSLSEISGWDAGYNFLNKNFFLNDDDIIFYANDTFYKRNYSDGGSSYLNFFSTSYLKNEWTSNIAIGYLDDFPKPVTLMGIKYSTWIRSNIFILSNNLSQKLHPFVFPLPKVYLFGGEREPFFTKINEVSPNWQAYISSWLFGAEDPAFPEYRLKWINNTPLTEENRLSMQIKAQAILSEHYLTARLHSMNINIADTNLFEKRDDRHIAPYYKC